MSVNENKPGMATSRVVKVHGQPLKKKPDRLPWPRQSEPDEQGRIVALGVDVVAKRQDIIKIVHKFFKVESISMDELLQEVYVAIIHKNCTRSAHDSRKSSFGHYIYMVANNVCINLVHRKRRHDKESDSIDAPYGSDDQRTLLDRFEAPVQDHDDLIEHMEEVEKSMRQRGMWDLARYMRAARSGADADVIREALSWGGRKISSKTIRDIRSQIQTIIHNEYATLT
jgi:hypothetical protein